MRSPERLAQMCANFERYEQLLAEVEKGLGEDAETIGGYGASPGDRGFAAMLKEIAERLREDRRIIGEGRKTVSEVRRRFEEADDDLAKNFR